MQATRASSLVLFIYVNQLIVHSHIEITRQWKFMFERRETIFNNEILKSWKE